MTERDKAKEDRLPHVSDEPTKPARQDVQPPAERVDDESEGERSKTTQRQE